ncbi:MAG: hypothetical protein HQK95_05310 [Nitrospirae bacterium]|nr:hypothetical protein [Nitrospirota bacterium]
MFDTLRVVESLKSSGFSEEGFTTAADLERVSLELKADIESSKSDIIKWVAAMLVAQTALIAGIAACSGCQGF